jgi:amino acid adenylation domain-containing protein
MNTGAWPRFEALCRSDKSADLLGDLEGCWSRRESLAAALAIAKSVEDQAGELLPNSIIAIHLPRDRRYLAAIFAVWARGDVLLPLNTAWPRAHVEHILRHAQADAVITLDTGTGCDYGSASVIRLPEVGAITSLTDPLPGDLEKWQQSRRRQQLVYIIYTSGSTGEQKGVCISHDAFCAYTDWAGRYWAHRRYSALLISAELTFDLALGDLAFALAHDVEMHVSPAAGNFFSHAYLIRERAIDVVYSVPSTLSRLLRLYRERQDISAAGLKLVISGGDVLSPRLVSDLQTLAPDAEFHNVYGPTEMTINCLAIRVDDLRSRIDKTSLVPIGRPFTHLQCLLYPESPDAIDGWSKGELLVAGVQAMNGYHRDEQRSMQGFIRLNGRQYYRTGDIVCRDPDGLYYFLGRKDNLVKVNGYRINPVEIDNLLTADTAVLECKTVAVSTGPGISRLISFAVTSAATDTDQLATRCREALPDYSCPERIILMPELPLGKTGKYDLERLKALARERLARISHQDGGLAGEVRGAGR